MTGRPCAAAPAAATAADGSTAVEVVRITDACTACGACLATCPEHALRRAPKRPEVMDDACTACWACIEICPAGAIVESWASAAAFVQVGGAAASADDAPVGAAPGLEAAVPPGPGSTPGRSRSRAGRSVAAALRNAPEVPA